MRIASLLALCLLFINANAVAQDNFYSTKWAKVYGFEYKDLPKSALATADTIFRKAKSENNVPQFTKALLYQSKFALTLNDDAELRIVDNFIKEIASGRSPQREILESMLANIYWSYFKQNRHKYYERTNSKETERPTDFRLWDPATMIQTIDGHFQKSLENAERLKKISLTSIRDILAEGENSKLYRPTLFDLLAHNALDFYVENLSWQGNFALRDSLGDLRTNELYKSLCDFHKLSNDTAAFVSVNNEYINYLGFTSKIDRQEKLRRFYALRNTYIRHEASTLTDFEIATIFHGDERSYRKALLTCDSAIGRFPTSIGARQNVHLRDVILDTDLRIESESFIPVDRPSLALVKYRNAEELTFSAYEMSDSLYESLQRKSKDSLVLRVIETLRPFKQWVASLKQTDDYRMHSTEIKIPALPAGRYLLFVKTTGSRGESVNRFDYSYIQVTNLVLLQTNTPKKIRFQVVDRMTGRPITKANVNITCRIDTRPVNEEFITGRDGFFEMDDKPGAYDIAATVRFGNDRGVFDLSGLYNYLSDTNEEEYDAKSILFTDRSIYRPGQTIYFKGILLKIKDNKASIVEGEYVEVSLRDVNYNDVATLRLKSNSFGSFNGEFKIPATGLTGEYTLEVDEDDEEESKFYDEMTDFSHSEVTISVEEYRRPTFEVTLKPVTKTFSVNDSVTVTGTAIAFSGSKLSHAKVAFHVTRMFSYSHWMYRNERRGSQAEILDSETRTDANGEFTIKFPARPDDGADKDKRPVFRYEVSVDVTDINGETHSTSNEVKVGYHLMNAGIAMPGEIERITKQPVLHVSTTNLNGQHVNSTGRVRIYKLQPPAAPLRERPWSAPDIRVIGEREFHEDFPYEAYNNENDPKNWEYGNLYLDTGFDTSKSTDLPFAVNSSWDLGVYAVELTALDPKGTAVTDKQTFKIIDKKVSVVADQQLIVFETDKITYTEDELIHIRVGSAAKDITFIVDVEMDNKIVKTFVEHLSGESREILLNAGKPGTTLYVHCTGVAFNSYISKKKTIAIASGKRMDIETISFRDKIQPGGKETWKFEIRGNGSEQKTAEVLASMYDASLDAFKPHSWDFTLTEPSWSEIDTETRQCFGTTSFQQHIANRPTWIGQSYDQFDWFGFSIIGGDASSFYRSRLYAAKSNPKQPSKVIMRNRRGGIDGLISGSIVDAEGLPVSGVSIVVKGTTRGTASDAMGRYEVEAKKGETLVFSFVGYATAEALIGNKNTIDVLLEETVMELSEVVVVGYGVQVARALTGSVTTISQSPLSAVSADYEFNEVLQGRANGVLVSQAGRTASILVRGLSSVDQKKVLYVVDGVLISSADIPTDDIASIEVLKGEAAISIYGSAAAHGVVIINTRSGQAKIESELAKVNARKNFNETAFFFPQLRTDEKGVVQFTFTSPESLTRWKLNLLAHNRDMEVASETLYTTTQKELMVTPNMPRFLRTNDEILLTAKISNLSSKSREGKAILQLTDPLTGNSLDSKFMNVAGGKNFKTAGKENVEVTWRLKIPKEVDAVQYRLVAKAGSYSDGEQNIIPVLSNRILITETVPMYVRGGQEKTFTITNLKNNTSATLQHHRLTLDVTSNPAWYAIQSLPYLMEFPHECAEQLFSRYYANAIGSHIVNSNPAIRKVFEQWNGTDALASGLEKNPEMKSILIEEAPWLRDAESETDQKKRIALLFDLYKMESQLSSIVDKLVDIQWSNGAFPWFQGSREHSRFITQHVASGFGHLKKLNVVVKDPRLESMMKKAVEFLDSEILNDYSHEMRIGVQQIQYLYMRSFFPEYTINNGLRKAIDSYMLQLEQNWQSYNLYAKAMIAMIHHRNNNTQVALDIIKSLKENSITSEELGMYWKENKASWMWSEAPVETQALLIEAFSEILPASSEITEMQLWLLKNKQTNRWSTTKATTEAVYAILLNGGSWLAEESQVQLTVGAEKIDLSEKATEPGSGYFKRSWTADRVTSPMGEVHIKKAGDGVAWGGLYWQYFEDIDHVRPWETPLKLEKKVFVVQQAGGNESMAEVTEEMSLKVGDLLRVRLTLSTDRDMEFLHLKDQRSSGTEPMDVLSEYHWRNGFGYYQSTKDVATHFFFDNLRKGVYVFEYDLRVNNRGDFANGIASIESMYAPEFSSHTTSVRMKVE
jgi:TonB-dependent SusC/RagA subfamily outer membrane receptor